jgi:hypothetical protein
VYHKEVIRLNPGDMLASVTPKKNLAVIMPVKLFVAAWQARTIAHRALEEKS